MIRKKIKIKLWDMALSIKHKYVRTWEISDSVSLDKIVVLHIPRKNLE